MARLALPDMVKRPNRKACRKYVTKSVQEGEQINEHTSTEQYKAESMEMLKSQFPRISVVAIHTVFKHCSARYMDAYMLLTEVSEHILGVPAGQGGCLDLGAIGVDFLKNTKQIVLQGPRRTNGTPTVSNRRLITEIDSLLQVTPPSETTEECGCCISDYKFEDMIQCEEGHLFCSTCVLNYVENQVFGQNTTELRCLNMASTCTASFTSGQLSRALPDKLRIAVDERIFKENTKNAKMDDLCTCPKCTYQAILAEGVSIFSCPECQHKSCASCGEVPHESKSCEEAKKAEKEKEDANARVADAMTSALVRECPNDACNVRFFKTSSNECNKMTCSSCKTRSCYLCRQKITGYDHFCQTPHCDHTSCGKCLIYTNSVDDDKKARKDAGLQEQKKLGEAAAAFNVAALVSPPSKTAKCKVNALRPALRPARRALGNAAHIQNQAAPRNPPPNQPNANEPAAQVVIVVAGLDAPRLGPPRNPPNHINGNEQAAQEVAAPDAERIGPQADEAQDRNGCILM
jgi:hypothetical protein